MKKTIIATLTIAMFAMVAPAEVTFAPTAGPVYADAGATPLPSGSLVAFIADMDGSGFDAYFSQPLSAGSFTLGDDVLLGIGSSGATEILVSNTYKFQNVLEPNTQGKPMAMLWFNTAYAPDMVSQGPAEGVAYGVFALGVNVPEDGKTDSGETFYTSLVGGNLANDAFYASYAVVPEPATMALLGLGGLAMIRRRRNG